MPKEKQLLEHGRQESIPIKEAPHQEDTDNSSLDGEVHSRDNIEYIEFDDP